MKLKFITFFNRNQFAGAFAIYFIGTIVLKGVSFITTPIFTRILSQTEYGIITIFLTWVSFFSVFIGLQVSGSIASAYVHKGTKQFNQYMKSIVVLSLTSALVIYLLSVIIRPYLARWMQIDSQLIPHLLIQSYGVACATLYSMHTILSKQPKKNVIFSVVVTLSIIALSMALILSFNENKYLGRIYAGTLVNVLVILYIFRRYVYQGKFNVRFSDWKYAVLLGSPLIIHLLSNIVISQSDRLFLKAIIGLEAAAIYSVCYNIAILGMLFAEVGNNVWSPWYLENTKKNNNLKVNLAAKKFALVTSFIFAVVMFVSPEVLMIMAPEEYWIGKNTLVIITASVYFQFLYRFPLGYEQYSENMKWVAVCTIIAGLINLGLNFILIKHIGLVGAAVATYISYIILFVMHEYVARKIIKGYNIRISSYFLGITITTIFAVITYALMDYWYLRYGTLFILFLIVGSIFIFRNKNALASSLIENYWK